MRQIDIERKKHRICLRCHKPMVKKDDYDEKRQKWYGKCKDCREIVRKEHYAWEEMQRGRRLSELEAMPIDIDTEFDEPKRKCTCCGRALRGMADSRGYCMVCSGAFQANVVQGDRMYKICLNCKWMTPHGDTYSCISRSGTGPITRDCLLFEERREITDGDENAGRDSSVV